MPVIIPASPPGVELESLTLDGIDLNSDTLWMESLSMPVPASLAEWIKGADSNGAILAREPLHENRVIEARIRVAQQATHDAVVAHIGAVLDKLQECGRNANGLPLVWDPANSTADPVTFRCLLGEITDLPIDWQDSGRFVNAWAFTIRLTCLPFGEGEEVEVATVTSAAPIIPLELEDIPGDVPALGRLVVTDAASQSRRYVAWGLESRWYDDSTSLIADSANMVTGAGYAGTAAAYAPAFGGSMIAAILYTEPQAICGLGDLSHVGSFRPQLRCLASTLASTIRVRLVFQAHDGTTRELSYKVPVGAGWNHIDMGAVTIPEATLGTQRWTGRIEAYSTESGQTLSIDAVWLMPAEQFGRARATYAYRAGVTTGADSFDALPTGTALNGNAATIGGSWATSGATTDIAATTGVYPGLDGVLVRGTTSDASNRNAILGSTNYTNVEVGVSVLKTDSVGVDQSVVARWVDSSNYFRLRLQSTSGLVLTMGPVVAGAATDTSVALGGSTVLTWYRLRLIVFASGTAIGQLLGPSGGLLAELVYTGTVTATGGTLATGKPGFIDRNATADACLRFYNAFYSATPAPEPIVCYSGQSIEFRHDATKREDSTGVYAGDPPEYIGGRFVIPNAGGPGRKARVGVIARRSDVATVVDDTVTSGTLMDSTTVTAFATPRYLAVPR